MKDYLKGIWNARYFWLHLARAELKYKFRRSRLGLLWTMIHPLVLTLMMALIFGNIFGLPVADFAPYIFSGMLVWEFMISSVVGGSNSLLVSENYIKQFKHPFAIYPLKTALVNITSFTIALTGLVIWIAVIMPSNLVISALVLPFSILLLFLIGWPLVILASFTHLKYRDFSQAISLVMQLFWYLSPVFLQRSMFSDPKLILLIESNPLTHILNLVRAPMLHGALPSILDYAYVFGTILVLYLAAVLRIRASEKKLIYYF